MQILRSISDLHGELGHHSLAFQKVGPHISRMENNYIYIYSILYINKKKIEFKDNQTVGLYIYQYCNNIIVIYCNNSQV